MSTYLQEISDWSISNKNKTQPHPLPEVNKMASYASR